MKEVIVSEKFRKWLYPVAIAVIALLVTYGVLTETDAAVWAALVAAVLGLGTAGTHIADDEDIVARKERKHAEQDKL